MAKVIVKAIEGECQGGFHKIGDEFEFTRTSPGGLCLGALGTILPYVRVLLCGGEFRWAPQKTKTRIHCPDPKGIVLEIEKVE